MGMKRVTSLFSIATCASSALLVSWNNWRFGLERCVLDKDSSRPYMHERDCFDISFHCFFFSHSRDIVDHSQRSFFLAGRHEVFLVSDSWLASHLSLQAMHASGLVGPTSYSAEDYLL